MTRISVIAYNSAAATVKNHQPSSSAATQHKDTSALIVHRLDLSRFSLFGHQKQNVERENKVASSIVDEKLLIQLDQLVTEVTGEHEITVTTRGTNNQSPISSQHGNDLDHTDEPVVDDGKRNCASVEKFFDCVSCLDEGAAAAYTKYEQMISRCIYCSKVNPLRLMPNNSPRLTSTNLIKISSTD